MNDILRIVVVDDQDLVRAGFVALLSGAPDLQVVGEAGQGDEAVRLVRATKPDVVLMDVRMPVLDGIEATRRITTDPACAGTRVVILTTFGLDEFVFGALRAGAVGFLIKDPPPSSPTSATYWRSSVSLPASTSSSTHTSPASPPADEPGWRCDAMGVVAGTDRAGHSPQMGQAAGPSRRTSFAPAQRRRLRSQCPSVTRR